MVVNLLLGSPLLAYRPLARQFSIPAASFIRWQSTSTVSVAQNIDKTATNSVIGGVSLSQFPLTRLSTWSLLRNIVLGFCLTTPPLQRAGLAFMQKIANSDSSVLNPDKNLLLRAMIKPLIYDHFCAGTNALEIRDTIKDIKQLGFAGVILCYGKEIQLGQDQTFLGAHREREREIVSWKEGNLKTLAMLSRDNWLGIKFTGAGQEVTEALLDGQDPPAHFEAAMHAICESARAKNCRIWIDAEQQAVQATIDRWSISFMRKYNTGPNPLIYNTLQAYLKESRHKLIRQLRMAQEEGWVFSVKLVRGAYISNDLRELIHDTKAETDASYNSLVRDLLSGSLHGFSRENFPKIRLFLAGHNSDSIRAALQLSQDLAGRDELQTCPEFGQLQGMADDIGCEIIQFGERAKLDESSGLGRPPFVPKVYKCLTWGSVQECMQYLVRRAVENSAAVDRMRQMTMEARKELGRRLLPQSWGPGIVVD